MSNPKEKFLDLLEEALPAVFGILGLILGFLITEQVLLIFGCALIGVVIGGGLQGGIRGFIEAKDTQWQDEPKALMKALMFSSVHPNREELSYEEAEEWFCTLSEEEVQELLHEICGDEHGEPPSTIDEWYEWQLKI